MLNFYTTKQGEQLEKRVAAVEEGGGSGGTTVEASTQTFPDAMTANALTIGDVNWNLPQGGGGGSSIPTIEIDCQALNLVFTYDFDHKEEEEIFNEATTVVLIESENPGMQEILGHKLIDYLKQNITEDNQYKLVFKNIEYSLGRTNETISLNKYSIIVNAFRYVYNYDGGFCEGLMISGGGSITIPLALPGMGVGGICTVNSGIIARLGDPNPEDPSLEPGDGWGNLAVSLAIPTAGIGL